MFYFWQSDWKSTHCTLLKQQLWYCHIVMLCHRQYILHVPAFRQVFVKLISKLLLSMINIKDRVRPQKLQPLKALIYRQHTKMITYDFNVRFHLCSRKTDPRSVFYFKTLCWKDRVSDYWKFHVKRNNCRSEAISGPFHVIQDVYAFLSSVENKWSFLMKTFQDLYHIVIFNGLHTVEGQNEFQCSFKGL